MGSGISNSTAFRRLRWTSQDVLVVVKTYPTPSAKHVETSCVAGVTRGSEWVRLYPVPFRLLETPFRRYQWISVRLMRNLRDTRPESHRIDPDSIVLGDCVGTSSDWAERWTLVKPLIAPSLEHLARMQKQCGKSLGLVRVADFDRLDITAHQNPMWSQRELAKLRRDQLSLFPSCKPATLLQKVPYEFHYRFRCEGRTCAGHRMQILDWEIGQLYHNCVDRYGQDWEKPLRAKLGDELPLKDLHLFVGTHSRRRGQWMIVGLFYPKKMADQEGRQMCLTFSK